MGLRQTAADDLKKILNDQLGWSWPITVTNPAGFSATFDGLANDISQVIDPDTGLVVTGRAASIALAVADMDKAGFKDLPKGIVDTSKKPWLVEFDDINGEAHKFKIVEAANDRSVGMVVCLLSLYKS